MKNNQLTGMLLGLLFLSTLATVGLIYKYNSSVHKLQALQSEVVAANNARGLVQAILTDTVEYSKTHPDINRLLQPYNMGSKPMTPAAPVKPGNK
ncbi:MAG: hypothetical protein JWQ04_3493 [Pedosphaera sp.]|nr:hypothetical protein [Pedosphaera sp.]